MSFDFLDNTRVRQLVTLAFLVGALLCMFPPDSYWLNWWASYAEIITLSYLAFGLFFLIIQKSKLMFVSFGCCAAISFYLNETNPKIKVDVPTEQPKLKLAHFNISSNGGMEEEFIQSVIKSNADFVSFQEVDPVWDSLLHNRFNSIFPFRVSLPQISPNGVSVFSKIKFNSVDTFYYENSPTIFVSITPPGSKKAIHIFSTYVSPPLSSVSMKSLRQHLWKLAFEINKFDTPVVALGDYNIVPWSPEIKEFRAATHLEEARRGIKPTVPDGKFPLFNVPLDHIFYSTSFECLSFESISNEYSDHLGIEAILQLKSNNELSK